MLIAGINMPAKAVKVDSKADLTMVFHNNTPLIVVNILAPSQWSRHWIPPPVLLLSKEKERTEEDMQSSGIKTIRRMVSRVDSLRSAVSVEKAIRPTVMA